MTKEKYTPFSEHTETIGKTTFSVTSYGDKTADKKANSWQDFLLWVSPDAVLIDVIIRVVQMLGL